MWNVSFRFCHNFSEVLVFVYPAQLKMRWYIKSRILLCVCARIVKVFYIQSVVSVICIVNIMGRKYNMFVHIDVMFILIFNKFIGIDIA